MTNRRRNPCKGMREYRRALELDLRVEFYPERKIVEARLQRAARWTDFGI